MRIGKSLERMRIRAGVKFWVLLPGLAATLCFAAPATPVPVDLTTAQGAGYAADIVVFGATPGGISAAVEAAKLGKHVALVEPTQHVGGVMSNGLGYSDIYFTSALSGQALDYFQRVNAMYGGLAAGANGTHFEPHVAETAFLAWLAQYPTIQLYTGFSLASVQKSGRQITGIVDGSKNSFAGNEFVDASYTGDLMAGAGVSYVTGREGVSAYGENVAGVTVPVLPFGGLLDPYVVPGNPSSGLLPHLSATAPPELGSADPAVMAYNYRLCVSSDRSNQTPFTPPPGYSAAEFEVLGRFLLALTAVNYNTTMQSLLNPEPLPNNKFDVNSAGFVSTDDVGANTGYVEGSAAVRASIEQEHQRYIRALLYFLSTDWRVPHGLQAQITALGYCRDEFTDNGNFPRQIYVRSARRMLGPYVMTEADVLGLTSIQDPAAMGGYQLDQHAVHRYVVNGTIFQEGTSPSVQLSGPYPISYRALVPRASEVTNLLVPVDFSSSYVAWESLRIEQTFMMTGQSVGAAASLAIDEGVSVQDVSYAALAARLHQDGLVLSLVPPNVTLGASSVTFPAQAVNTQSSAATLVSLTNNGTSPVKVLSVTLTGADAPDFLSGTDCPSPIATGVSCNIRLRFAPKSQRAFAATVNVLTSASTTPLTIAVSGTVTIPTATLSSTSVTFTPVAVKYETDPAVIVTLKNTGSGSMVFQGIGLTGTGASNFLAGTDCPGSIAVGQSCNLRMRFFPQTAGTFNANLIVASDDPKSPVTISLSGTSSVPKIALSSNSVAFAPLSVNMVSDPVTVVMLTNPGTLPLAIEGITLTGTGAANFQLGTDCPLTVAAGSTCNLRMRFAPRTAGASSATISIATNASGTPATISLSGTGTVAGITLATTRVSFASVPVNTQGALTLVPLSSSGTEALVIKSMALSGAQAANFQLGTDCPVILAVGGSCNIRLRFYPRSGGESAATLTILTNAPTSPNTIALTASTGGS